MSLTLKHSKSHHSSSFPSKSAYVNVFDEVLKRLEMIESPEVRTQAISYDMIFTGFYRDIGLEFNVLR